MQEEAPTTRAARETPFRLLVALSSNENSTGEVFLDDGEGVEMGSDGGRWTLVQYNGYILGSTAAVESRVDNAEYALSQKCRLDQVTVLGLNHSVGLMSYELMIKTGGNWIKKSSGKSSFDNGGQFAVVEISGIYILMGEEFRLKLNLSM